MKHKILITIVLLSTSIWAFDISMSSALFDTGTTKIPCSKITSGTTITIDFTSTYSSEKGIWQIKNTLSQNDGQINVISASQTTENGAITFQPQGEGTVTLSIDITQAQGALLSETATIEIYNDTGSSCI